MCFVICSCGTSPSNMLEVLRGVPYDRLLTVSFVSGWRSWRSARGCFIPLQKLIVASPLEWALISSSVLKAD